MPGEQLYLYVAATANAISGVLIREEDRVQKLVYFVSRALHGPEVRYTAMEKLVLALVHAARRLRPYFQAHPICVLTNQNIRGVLQKPDTSGRLMKWAIELGEHEIEYRPRTAIKGQALADFLVEMSGNTEVAQGDPKPNFSLADQALKEWKFFVDGASNEDGSGAGVLLVDPEGQEWAYALRFNFKATNNEAEYEALIAGLRIANSMQVQRINVFSDSQIVVQQVRGTYEARDANLKKYLTVVRSLIKALGQVTIQNKSHEVTTRGQML